MNRSDIHSAIRKLVVPKGVCCVMAFGTGVGGAVKGYSQPVYSADSTETPGFEGDDPA